MAGCVEDYGEDVWDCVGALLASDPRLDALRHLEDGAAIPSDIGRAVESNQDQVSRALSDLREQGVVELLVSEDRRKGRLYGLTEKGEKVVECGRAMDVIGEDGVQEAAADDD